MPTQPSAHERVQKLEKDLHEFNARIPKLRREALEAGEAYAGVKDQKKAVRLRQRISGT